MVNGMIKSRLVAVNDTKSVGDDTLNALCQLDFISPFQVDKSEDFKAHNSEQYISQHKKGEEINVSSFEQVNSGNNRSETTVLCTQEKKDLRSWGLPEAVLKQYHLNGVKSMFPWQVECLCNPRILEGGNLVYSAPTSAGKTLVAEVLAIKTVLEKKKKVIIILPFVSVVREKMFYFQNLLGGSGVRVEGLMGSHRIFGGFKKIHIAVCTIEKANSLINRLLEDGHMRDLGAVIVDELHLLGDPFRGYLLELLLTKIQYVCMREKDVSIQIIGMSATLPNLDLLGKWLKADLYKTDFRPVPLKEFLKVESVIYDTNLKPVRILQPEVEIQDDGDHVIYLCLETLFLGHSVLVFCPTKNWSEKLAQHIAKEFQLLGNSNHELASKLRCQLNTTAIVEALERLKRCPVGLDTVLKKTVSFGVAFHHAGLTIDERDIIEGLFREGVLRVLVATSTLSSGVNLPARRVIIRSPLFCGEVIGVQTYHQMIGRAGRMGKDTSGESFLICSKSEKRIGEILIQADLQPVQSCLGYGELSSSLKRAVLEVVASGVATTPEQIDMYMNCTLLSASESVLENPIKSCINFLSENELIRLQTKDEETQYVPTPLGAACLAASISPDDGLELFRELQKARQCFVLENDLHLVYQVTPLNIASQWGNLDWFQVLALWEQLPTSMRRVGELVGVEEIFMVRALRGTINLQSNKEIGRINRRKLAIHRRFYTALALQDLIDEVPLTEVAMKFRCTRGMLQSLQQSASTYAGMVTAFCKRLGWDNMELLFSQFQDRLQFGIHRELCDLMRLDLLNGIRARALFNAGITSLACLAAAEVCEVENALHKAIPFQSSKEQDGETAFDTAKRNEMKAIWITGRQGLTESEAAVLLITEARIWLQRELGLADAKWDATCGDRNSSSSQNLSGGSLSQSSDSIKMGNLNESMSKEIFLSSPHLLKEETNVNSDKLTMPEVCPYPNRQCPKSKLNHFTLGRSILKPTESESCRNLNDEYDQDNALSDNSAENCAEKETLTARCKETCQKEESQKNYGSSTVPQNIIEEVEKLNAYNSLKLQSQNNIKTEESVVNNCKMAANSSPACNYSNSDGVSMRRSTDLFLSPGSEKTSPSLFGESLLINTQLGDILDCSISPAASNIKSDAQFSSENKNTSNNLIRKLNSPQKQKSLLHTGGKKSNICKGINADALAQNNLENEPDLFLDDSIITESFIDNAFRIYVPSNQKTITDDYCNNVIEKASFSEITQTRKYKKNGSNDQQSVKHKRKIEITDSFVHCNSPSKKIKQCSDKNNEKSPQILLLNKSIRGYRNDSVKPFSPNKSKNNGLKFNKVTVFHSSSEDEEEITKTVLVSASQKYSPVSNKSYNPANLQYGKFDTAVASDEHNGEEKKLYNITSMKHLDCKKQLVKNCDEVLSLTKNPSQRKLDSALDIITISAHGKVFDTFRKELSSVQHIAIALAGEHYKSEEHNIIGSKIIGKRRKPSVTKDIKRFVFGEKQIVGAAVCCGGCDVYYMQLNDQGDGKNPVAIQERLNLLQHLMSSSSCQFSVSAFGIKELYKYLHHCVGIQIQGQTYDPKVADWLLDAEGKEKNLNAMALQYCPDVCKAADIIGSVQGLGSPGMDINSSVSAQLRACVEAFVTWHVVESQIKKLEDEELRNVFEEIEMPTQLCLAQMEINGIGFCAKEAERLRNILLEKMNVFENLAYKMAGHTFSLTSPNDVAKVLFVEMGLNPEPVSRGQKLSTNKEALLRLKHLHPLPEVILQWRKINTILTKTIYPLLNAGSGDRMFGCYVTHTATGRISMHEPNMQNIPRDFDIDTCDKKNMSVSMRLAFIPKSGKVLLSADYSQLELRILAHLSGDKILSNILNSGQDVFCGIASIWNKIPEHQVTEKLRQCAKKVCYGMIYGIGAKSLADQLDVDENEAAEFMETFKSAYPGIGKYIEETIKQCRLKGYVETLHGRKRYLRNINNPNPAIRAHAERQAVNSTIQGSAADVAKKGMVLVEASLAASFSMDSTMTTRQQEAKLYRRTVSTAEMVLHLHDELIYEVSKKDLAQVARIVKSGMESAAVLTVQLPVKIKAGSSWGTLKEMDVT